MIRFLLWALAMSWVVSLGGDLLRIELKTCQAPRGVVSLQLASTPSEVKHVLSGWDPSARERVSRNISLDYRFIAAYVMALFLALLWAAEQAWSLSEDFGPKWFWRGLMFVLLFVAVAQIGAGALDAWENRGMERYLEGQIDAVLVSRVSTAAKVKFGIVIAGVASVLFVGGAWLYHPLALFGRRAALGRDRRG